MQLANDLKRALGRKRAGAWKAAGYAVKIRTGRAKLYDLESLAREAKCSLVYLTSGGEYGVREEMRPVDAVTASIIHAGLDKHDFARSMGFRDYSYVATMLRERTIPVRTLMRFADALGLKIWELLSDSECVSMEYESRIPTQWDQLVELNLMGWLDAKKRDKYEKKEGPGI